MTGSVAVDSSLQPLKRPADKDQGAHVHTYCTRMWLIGIAPQSYALSDLFYLPIHNLELWAFCFQSSGTIPSFGQRWQCQRFYMQIKLALVWDSRANHSAPLNPASPCSLTLQPFAYIRVMFTVSANAGTRHSRACESATVTSSSN